MRRIMLLSLICLALCCPSALLLGQTISPGAPIINWVDSSPVWDGIEVRYGKFCVRVPGGLVIASVETGAHTVFTTADGVLGGSLSR